VYIVIASEITGLLYFYSEEGKIFYMREQDAEGLHPETKRPETKGAVPPSTFFRLNPYFGYSIQSGISLEEYVPLKQVRTLSETDSAPAWLSIAANNYGFFSRYTYPYHSQNSDEFVIGIFGGSVAHWFAIQAEEKLAYLLRQLPQFQDRQITILNFAAGGYKQPQQLLILNFFLVQGQKFDVVLNIDGFNEVALADRNREYKTDAAMPSAQHLVAFAKYLSKEQLESSYVRLLSKLLTAKEKAAKAKRDSETSLFASFAFFHRFIQLWHNSTYVEAQLEFDNIGTDLDSTSLLQLQSIPEYKEFSDIREKSLGLWLESSKRMKILLDHAGASYLHILQPNQYVSQKQFSQEERELATTGSAYNVEAVQLGYQSMKEAGKTLKEQGIQFFDATNIFDKETTATFSDNCCHLNQEGNNIFARYVRDILDDLMD
jgi:hypothetical protein